MDGMCARTHAHTHPHAYSGARARTSAHRHTRVITCTCANNTIHVAIVLHLQVSAANTTHLSFSRAAWCGWQGVNVTLTTVAPPADQIRYASPSNTPPLPNPAAPPDLVLPQLVVMGPERSLVGSGSGLPPHIAPPPPSSYLQRMVPASDPVGQDGRGRDRGALVVVTVTAGVVVGVAVLAAVVAVGLLLYARTRDRRAAAAAAAVDFAVSAAKTEQTDASDCLPGGSDSYISGRRAEAAGSMHAEAHAAGAAHEAGVSSSADDERRPHHLARRPASAVSHAYGSRLQANDIDDVPAVPAASAASAALFAPAAPRARQEVGGTSALGPAASASAAESLIPDLEAGAVSGSSFTDHGGGSDDESQPPPLSGLDAGCIASSTPSPGKHNGSGTGALPAVVTPIAPPAAGMMQAADGSGSPGTGSDSDSWFSGGAAQAGAAAAAHRERMIFFWRAHL